MIPDINFNLPVSLDTVFKVESGEEFKSELTFCWHQLEMVQEYPFKNGWNTYPGDKCYLHIASSGQYVALVSYEKMKNTFYEYKKFITNGEDPED